MASTIRCSSCAAELSADSRFCRSCGQATSALSQMVTAAGPAVAARVGRLVSSDAISVGGFTPGTILADRYRIIGLLGRGGMGDVYRADDLKLGQSVALKFLSRALSSDPVRRERLFAEVRITRQLSHPNICRVYDIAEFQGQHFLTMEFIDGEDLASLIKRIGYLSNEKGLEIIRQLVAGLAAAHERGVLHRDLKPANIMIDGHGRVRVTDFGLAIVATDEVQEGDVSGTPAYMAPEQLAGKSASVRSDIYALGLVIYEISCGKKAFTATSIAELRHEKEQRTPTAPSDFRGGIDPIVERLIMRCLERDPRARPASVAQLAAALPGGDPLAAALAAGETPSPEMLIASGPKEGLRPAVAVALLALVILGSLAVAAMNDRVGLVPRAKLTKSPEALIERARQFIEKAGYSADVTDSASGFFLDSDVLRYLQDTDATASRWNNLDASGAVGFFYRQSPRPLAGGGPVSGPGPEDPPLQYSGEVEVRLDGDGRLRTFEAVPPRVGSPALPPSALDWAPLFSDAGLGLAHWTPVEPQRNPLFYADTRAAWHGSLPDAPAVPVRIEAAAYQGKPVSFEIVGPWTPATPTRALSTGSDIAPANLAGIVVGLGVLGAGGLYFARRNLRLGRGDRRGATRLMLVVLGAQSAAWILTGHHVVAVGSGLSAFGGLVLTMVGLLWVFYIAVEPFVRRRWPRMLVSWTRLLSGDWRDPLVGRDVLIGCAAGVSVDCLTRFGRLASSWLGYPEASPALPNWNAVNGIGSFVGDLLGSFSIAMFAALALLFFLFLLRVVLRRDWIAGAALVFFLAAAPMQGSVGHLSGVTFWINMPLALTVGLLILFTQMRAGLVAATLTWGVVQILNGSQITLRTSAWYSGIGYAAILVIVAISIYGFLVSLGGRSILATTSVDD